MRTSTAGMVGLAMMAAVHAAPATGTLTAPADPRSQVPSKAIEDQVPENIRQFSYIVREIIDGMIIFADETCRNPNVTKKATGAAPDDTQKEWWANRLEELNARLKADTERFWSSAADLKVLDRIGTPHDSVLYTGFVVPEYKEPFFDAQRCISKARTGYEGRQLVPLPTPKAPKEDAE